MYVCVYNAYSVGCGFGGFHTGFRGLKVVHSNDEPKLFVGIHNALAFSWVWVFGRFPFSVLVFS